MSAEEQIAELKELVDKQAIQLAALTKRLSKSKVKDGSSSSPSGNFPSTTDIKLGDAAADYVKAELSIPNGLPAGGDITKVIELLDDSSKMQYLRQHALSHAFWKCLAADVKTGFTRFLVKNKLFESNSEDPYDQLVKAAPKFFKTDFTPDVYLERLSSKKFQTGSSVDSFVLDMERSYVEFVDSSLGAGCLAKDWRENVPQSSGLVWCIIRALPAALAKSLLVAVAQVPRDTWSVELLRVTLLTLEKSRPAGSIGSAAIKVDAGGGSADSPKSKYGGEIICHRCGEPGHKSYDCPNKRSHPEGSTGGPYHSPPVGASNAGVSSTAAASTSSPTPTPLIGQRMPLRSGNEYKSSVGGKASDTVA
jgi:hypothetical protein